MADPPAGHLRHRFRALAGPIAPVASSSLLIFPPPFPSFPSSIGATQTPEAAPPLRQHLEPAGAANAVYCGVRQRSCGSWVAEITDRNTKKKVWVGSFPSAEQAARAYDIENVRLHGTECGELTFPLGVEGQIPDEVAEGLFFVSDRERQEDREARERRDAAIVAALAGHNPQLVEEERNLLEAYAEAKQKADAAAGKKAEKQEDAGPSTTPAVIELDSDCSSYDWDED